MLHSNTPNQFLIVFGSHPLALQSSATPKSFLPFMGDNIAFGSVP